jgi:P-type E1-E2 ATPase
MLSIDIPGRGTLALERLVLDVNGTIAEDGHLIPGVRERISRLARSLEVVMVTADTYGRQSAIDGELGMEAVRLGHGQPEAPQKAELVRKLGAAGVVAIGNGANDAQMLKEAALSIAVLGPEGTSLEALQNADLVARSIIDALELLLHPRRLVATLRQ